MQRGGVAEGAMCAVHPTMRAVLTCERCGNFACAACRSEAGVCKACAGRGAVAGVSDEQAAAIRRKMRVYNLASFAIALPGLFLSAAGRAQPDGDPAGTGLIVIGTVLFTIGLGFYARMKNRSLLAGLWGLLSCFGLLILAAMKKRCHHCQRMAGARAKQCEACGAPM